MRNGQKESTPSLLQLLKMGVKGEGISINTLSAN